MFNWVQIYCLMIHVGYHFVWLCNIRFLEICSHDWSAVLIFLEILHNLKASLCKSIGGCLTFIHNLRWQLWAERPCTWYDLIKLQYTCNHVSLAAHWFCLLCLGSVSILANTEFECFFKLKGWLGSISQTLDGSKIHSSQIMMIY
jgi:hypothetical protein